MRRIWLAIRLFIGALFNAEVADTTEVGVKGRFLDGHLNANLSLYKTESKNGYFFVFLAANSTQNLGNLDADYKGAELELNAQINEHFSLYGSFGYTNSKITDMEDPSVIGNEAPLVSRTTTNLGAEFRQPLGNGLDATFRTDYQRIGRTWWEPYNITSRDPVSLVDARLGVEGAKWSLTAWSKNLGDAKYNAEFSPGNVGGSGFLWRALPRRYGLTFDYRF